MYKLIGRKKEMTQRFDENWKLSPVTLVGISGNVLARKNGKRVWVGFGRKRNPSKAELGTFRRLGYVPAKVIEADGADFEAENVRVSPDKIGTSIIKKELLGARIEITGITKGKGFAGGHKRFDIKGGPSTRGQSTTQRKIGSVGSQTPGRVYKGVKMPGHMGHLQVTIKNLKIVFFDEKKGVIGIQGHVPGSRSSIVTIKVREWGKPAERGEGTEDTEQKKERQEQSESGKTGDGAQKLEEKKEDKVEKAEEKKEVK